MNRRAVLRWGAVGLLGAAAGCAGDTPEPSGPNDTWETTNEEPKRAGVGERIELAGGDAIVRNPGVERYLILMDGIHPAAHADAAEKYLALDVSGANLEVGSADLVAVADGERHEPLDRERWSGATSEAFHAAFPFPADAETEDASVRLETADGEPLGVWELGTETVAAFNNPPAPELLEVSAPERVAPGEQVTVTLEVENTGAREGAFRYGLGPANRSALSPGSITVPAGETVTHTAEVRRAREDEDSVTIVLDDGRGEHRFDVSVG